MKRRRVVRGEFSHCTADRDEGDSIVGDTIAKLIELNAPQDIIDQQIAAQSGSIAVVIADDMSSDDYFPDHLVDKGKGLLIALCLEIEARKPTTEPNCWS